MAKKENRRDRFTWKKGDLIKVEEGSKKTKKNDRSGHLAWGPGDLVRVDKKDKTSRDPKN
jgi:hypothetical protein